MIGQNGPVDPGIEFALRIARLEADIAELKRLLSRVSGVGAWQTLTLTIGSQTVNRTVQWRYNAGRVELRGSITRTAALAAGTTIANLGSGGNPPTPGRDYSALSLGSIVAATPDVQAIGWVADDSGVLRLSGATWALASGDVLDFDGVSWPIA